MAGQGAAPARVALVGNPSDAYRGRVLALAVPCFAARVEALDTPAAPLATGLTDLVDAAEAVFAVHAQRTGQALGTPPAGWRCVTSVPRQVGLAGSSAVVVATLRALVDHHGVDVEPEVLPSVALAAETEVLGVHAGLQDRVAQVHGTLVDVDVSPAAVTRRHGWTTGRYRCLDPARLPPLWLAWRERAAESSGIVHGDLRTRFEAGDQTVTAAMGELAGLAERAAAAIEAGDGHRLGPLMDASIDVRRSVVDLRPDHAELVDAARSVPGVHVNYAGSGGAVVGTVPPAGADEIETAMRALGARWLALTTTATGGAQ